ncbi:RNA-directed DNA polymerase, eukaryota [Tanacetum coccineum]
MLYAKNKGVTNIEEDDFSDSGVELLQAKNDDIFNKDDIEIEEVPKIIFEHGEQGESKSPVVKDQLNDGLEDAHTEDPFSLYKLLNMKHPNSDDATQFVEEHKYPHGFTPLKKSVEHSNMENIQNSQDQIEEPTVFKTVPITKLMRMEMCLYVRVTFKMQETKMEQIDGFDSFVADTWKDSLSLNLNLMLRLVTKLKHLKVEIRKWTKEKTVKSVNIKKGLKTKLADIDHSLDKGEASSNSLEERMRIMSKLADLEKIDSLELAQKAKIKWSIEGDENSKYFHGIINKQRNNIVIRGILVDGAWIEDPRIVKNEFFTHFKDRFNITSFERLTLDMEFLNKLSIDQKTDLERPFTKEEIKGAIWDCGLNKYPGPDGFTFGFYQRYWCLLEPNIVDAVNHFFTHGFPRKGCNSSFITLIPKSHDAKQVKDFRPISLVGSLYKTFVKLLANRLVLVMGNLINEVVNFEKAFDSVRWDFLDDVLKKFGFGDRWCDWIQSCLRSSRSSILVNGSPTYEFQFHKGLKQGDPLSPFLFILIMESLHLSFQNVVNASMFKGITLDNSLQLSHLFYGDDVVFLGQWCDSNIKTIIRVLDCFYRASGLRINLHKSKIMGIAVDSSIVDLAAADIGCMILKSPFSYLGVKIGGRMRCINSWKEIINKILSRLSKWKMKTLSIGGHLMLLKSVSGVDHKDQKISLVKWKNVLASKEKGGLGVLSFHALNRSLIFKWIWRFRTQNSSLWARVIKTIHGMDVKVGCTPSANFSFNWIDIVREAYTLRDQGIDILGLITKKVGNGMNTMFWEEPWKDNVPLKYLFPRIYALESIKSITVAEKVTQPGLVSSPRRMQRGGIEQHQMADLCLNMEDTILPNMMDRWFWSLTGSGEFSVASARNFIDDHSLVDSAPKTRWSKTVPKKINIHVWRVKMDNLPMRFNLSRRGIDLDSIYCPICNMTAETTSHILFNCPMAKDIYKKIASWWDVNMLEVYSYDDWCVWFKSLRIQAKLKTYLEGVFFVTWWTIWTFRNKLIFGSSPQSKDHIVDDIVARSFSWCRSRCNSIFSWVDWLKNPSLISL